MKLLALGLALFLQPSLPALTGRVVDLAGILSPAEEETLVRRLETIETETSVQIVVATIRSLEGEPIEDYSIRLAESWKIGQAGLDNGAIIVVVPSERRVRIEVGYGLEPVIPDGVAGRIMRERMTPAFREGNYYAGISSAVEGLELAARKEYPEAPARRTSSPSPVPDIGSILIVYFILGVLGNAIGILLGVIGGAIAFPLLGGSLAAALGWWAAPLGGFLGLFAVLILRGLSNSGSWTWHPPRGGGFGGGGFGGGGFGGGGFGGGGGFRGGGGSFGGGGASGSW
jgi:uncharacterized protein